MDEETEAVESRGLTYIVPELISNLLGFKPRPIGPNPTWVHLHPSMALHMNVIPPLEEVLKPEAKILPLHP